MTSASRRPDDFSTSCSTPKRQRLSHPCAQTDAVAGTLAPGQSRSTRRISTRFGLSDQTHLSVFCSSPFDTPTKHRYSTSKERLEFKEGNCIALAENHIYDSNNGAPIMPPLGSSFIGQDPSCQIFEERTLRGSQRLEENGFYNSPLRPLHYGGPLPQSEEFSTKQVVASRPVKDQNFQVSPSGYPPPNQGQQRQSSTKASCSSGFSFLESAFNFNSSSHIFPTSPRSSTLQASPSGATEVLLSATSKPKGEMGASPLKSALATGKRSGTGVSLLPLTVTTSLREASILIEAMRRAALTRGTQPKERSVWTVETLRAFDEAIRTIPRLGRAKLLALTSEGRKPFGRNELIADYIYRRTGVERDRKQVSSHIQVIKNAKKVDPLLAELLGPSEDGENLSFDENSASWFGACITNDAVTLYACTPEFPFASQVLQHLPPPQSDKDYLDFLLNTQGLRYALPNKRSAFETKQFSSSLTPTVIHNSSGQLAGNFLTFSTESPAPSCNTFFFPPQYPHPPAFVKEVEENQNLADLKQVQHGFMNQISHLPDHSNDFFQELMSFYKVPLQPETIFKEAKKDDDLRTLGQSSSGHYF